MYFSPFHAEIYLTFSFKAPFREVGLEGDVGPLEGNVGPLSSTFTTLYFHSVFQTFIADAITSRDAAL